MNQLKTTAIILTRIDYGEADRIITLLTPEAGKLSLMARGVRKPKSKLAGGIELFSVSDITYIRGRGELGTLISSRLLNHYGNIVKDITRVQLGYELIKSLHKATEDQPEPEYFELLQTSFRALDNAEIATELIQLWFQAQLLQMSGHQPNLATDTSGQKLSATQKYSFDFEAVSFASSTEATLTADHIKVLRLLFGQPDPRPLSQVTGLTKLLPDIGPLIRAMLTSYIRV